MILLAGAAWGAPTLEYRAPTTCPSADAFADRVSERVSGAPFGAGPGHVSVWIRRSGGRGSLRSEGSVTTVRGEGCAEVFDALVDQAATSLGGPAATDPPVAVEIVSSRPVNIGLARPALAGSSARIRPDPLCHTPCTFSAPPGPLDLVAYGSGNLKYYGHFELSGPPVNLGVAPVPRSRRYAALALEVAGLSLVEGGVLLTCANLSTPCHASGPGALGVGAFVVSVPLLVTSTWLAYGLHGHFDLTAKRD